MKTYEILQRSFQKHLRLYYYQRSQQTEWHTWMPPGIVFCRARLTKNTKNIRFPPLSEWYFDATEQHFSAKNGDRMRYSDSYRVCNVDLTLQDPDSIVNKCFHNSDELFVGFTNDFSKIFRTFFNYMKVFKIDPHEISVFPNLRIIYTHYKYIDKFFPFSMVKDVYVNLDSISSHYKLKERLLVGKFPHSFSLKKYLAIESRISGIEEFSSYNNTGNNNGLIDFDEIIGDKSDNDRNHKIYGEISESLYYDKVMFTQNMVNRLSSIMMDYGQLHIYSSSLIPMQKAIRSIRRKTSAEVYESVVPNPYYIIIDPEDPLNSKRTVQNDDSHNDCSREDKKILLNGEKDSTSNTSPVMKSVGKNISAASNIYTAEKENKNDTDESFDINEILRIKLTDSSRDSNNLESPNEDGGHVDNYAHDQNSSKVKQLYYANFVRIPNDKPNFRLKSPLITF